jgi:hypothetical protein
MDMTDAEIELIRNWTGRFNVGDRFTFEGWDAARREGEAKIIFQELVAAIKAEDPRVNFLALATGPGTDGVDGPKKTNNARYYRRLI